MTFIGIDPTAGQKPYTYVALDEEKTLLALGQGTMEDVLAFVAGQETAFVAVNAPRGPNRGIMAQEETRQQLTPQPRPGRWMDYRLAEYLLRQHHIGVMPTPADEKLCPNWVQSGFAVYRHLDALGFIPFPGGETRLQSLEVHPHASFCALLGQIPFQKETLEGRLQRQLILRDLGLRIPDAMMFFEEVTRHRLLKGVLPLKDIYTAVELDALVAAYTAWLAAAQPEAVISLGEPVEGKITLPVAELKYQYSNA